MSGSVGKPSSFSFQPEPRCASPWCQARRYCRGYCVACYYDQRGTFCEVCDQLEMVPCPSCGRVA